MRLVLFRHADKELQGHRDNPPLSRTGQQQAAQILNEIENGNLPRPTKMLSSPKARAQETFLITAEKLAVEIQVSNDLDEKRNHENAQQFRKRIQSLCNKIESLSGVIYLCTHYDWLEEFCSLIHTDANLSDVHWTAAHYLEFEISDRQWHLTGEGDIS